MEDDISFDLNYTPMKCSLEKEEIEYQKTRNLFGVSLFPGFQCGDIKINETNFEELFTNIS